MTDYLRFIYFNIILNQPDKNDMIGCGKWALFDQLNDAYVKF
jgi:hypothetical protein